MTAVVAAVLGAGAPVPAQPERVLGVDISYWNCGTSSTGISQANWTTGFTTGDRQFVFLRSTRGGTTGVDQPQGTPGGGTNTTLSRRYDDPRFIQNMGRAIAAGMLAGPYHFARPDAAGNTGTDEANHFIQMAGAWMRPGYLLPVFDQEAGSGSGSDTLAQFAIDFSSRIYAVMQIRPGMYINGNYSGIFQGATQARRNTLAQPAAYTPSVVGPAYPMLWDAFYTTTLDRQTANPKDGYSGFYGPWDDYGVTHPWVFWQHTSTASVAGFNNVDSTIDSNVAHGDIEFVRNYLVPAIWWHDGSGDWSTLTNWNSGQAAVAPVTPADQATPYATTPIPAARLPGAAGSGPASGQYDTVILERPNANVTVTLSTGAHNVRKLYQRETLNITGGTLTINYDPAYRPDTSTTVLHGGPVSAQFSGPVILSGSGSLTVHTLQVDTNRVFTLAGGTLTFNKIALMPHSTTPARILLSGGLNLNALSNVTATIAKGGGTGSSGFVDLGGANRAWTVGNGTNDVDLSVEVPITNGALTKAGAGTLQVVSNNTYSGGTTLTAGRLLVNNVSGSGTGSGAVTVNGGVLGGTGTIAGPVALNSGGTLSPGKSVGTLTLNSAPVLNGTNFMEINRNGGAPLADKVVLTSGTLTYGGTLVVSNTGAALQGGDVFTLFAAPAYAGAFVRSNLPALAVGLNWHLGALPHNGTLKVNRRPVVSGALAFTNVAPAVLQIPFTTLIANATDADGDPLTVTAISLTSTSGIPLLTNAGFVSYSNRVSLADQFSYVLGDGCGGSTTGAVSIVNIGSTPAAHFVGTPIGGGNSVQLHFAATPGWTYCLERSTNLTDWTPIWTHTAPANGAFDYTDGFHDLAAPPPTAFYRLSWPP